jgi:hypothetical protein
MMMMMKKDRKAQYETEAGGMNHDVHTSVLCEGRTRWSYE